jgi:ligand-binding sensor domain-containing protein
MDNRVFSLALAADGAVWAGTYFGASIKQGDAWSFYDGFHTCANPGDHCGPLWSYQIADLAPLSDGAMWMAVDLWIIGVYPKPGGVARRNAAGLTDTWDMSSGLPSNDAQAVAASDTAVYAGNGEGLALYRADLNEFQIIAQVGVYCLAFGPGGALWVGGPDGARAYTAGDWTHWTIGDGLPADSVRALAASEQMICFGTNAGVGCYAEIGGEWTYPWVPPGDAAR